ncbi:hypothetical protein M3Y98_00804900 [Aphelenchoides besseyi]|nr:hypothetical protein M3Y98_00804900 [Aphelenchoides besseyi]KAI6212076.1 hypothetical protein M3Y96_00501900 [Aphelenchoides besseyi]
MYFPLILGFVFVVSVDIVDAAMARDFGDLGLPYSFNFGAGNSQIKREWDDAKRPPQTIKVGTDYWTTNGSDQIDKGNVFLHKNGTLEIKKFGPNDVAAYTMPDEPENRHGNIALAPTMLIVSLRD